MILVVVLVGAVSVKAAANQLNGWSWSSTIGWIGFDIPSLSGTDIISVDSATGNITGYVWSSNIGWIKFGGLSGFPAGFGTAPGNASVNFTTGAVTGWARACSGTVNKDCASASRTDGWDGWIALSGTNFESPVVAGNKGVTYASSTKKFVGYGWGDTNVGWVNFAPLLATTYVDCPACVGGDTALTAVTCSGPTSLTLAGASISGNFIANPQGGKGNLTYSWTANSGPSISSGSSQKVATVTYTSTSTSPYPGPRITVTDSATPPVTQSGVCSDVAVVDSGPGGGTADCPMNIPNTDWCSTSGGEAPGVKVFDHGSCPTSSTANRKCSFECKLNFRLSSGECVRIIVNPT